MHIEVCVEGLWVGANPGLSSFFYFKKKKKSHPFLHEDRYIIRLQFTVASFCVIERSSFCELQLGIFLPCSHFVGQPDMMLD